VGFVKRLILLISAGASLLLGFGPARALADGTASADGVTATLTSEVTIDSDRVTISAPGTPAFSATVPCGVPCGGTLQVARTNPGPRPDVALVFYEASGPGGVYELVDFSWSVSAHTWVQSDAGYPYPALLPTLEPLGVGYHGIVSDVPLIPYDSRGPIDIRRAIDGQVVDVTRRYPALVAADAARWLAAYAAAPADDNAVQIAAWAADESTLGRGARAASYLASQGGQLFYASEPLSPAQLETILTADGYPL
jgi:hypothetical protein